MGVAVGGIGMSRAEFLTSYADEFEAILHEWGEVRDSGRRDSWERMRLLAAITIQPHVKRKMAAEKLLPLPWDGRRPETSGAKPEAPAMTREEQRARGAELAAKMGLEVME